jgi:hypothetical protein
MVTVSTEEKDGPDPIPEYGDEASTANEPFSITSRETLDDDPSGADPDPIPAPFVPLALILPPQI